MCLTLKSDSQPCPLVAEKDISVYKMIQNNNLSFYERFPYTPNTLYALESPLCAIDHTYCCSYDGTKLYNVHEGFHSYTLEAAVTQLKFIPRYAKLVAFTIPKGAHYFIGTEGELVSDKIRSGSLKSVTNALLAWKHWVSQFTRK